MKLPPRQKPERSKPALKDYCQYLLVTQTNYTQTYFDEHSDKFSHDSINRLLKTEKVTPRMIWEQAQTQVVASPDGFVVFDDTVLNKKHSFKIELVRRQWSGNEKRVIKGIGVVTCVYVNPQLNRFWMIDYRIYDPDGDGKSKLDHVQDMLTNIVHQRKLPFHAVLMDTWYAAKSLMLFIEKLDKIYYCPLKCNRNVDDSGGEKTYQHVDSLTWTNDEAEHGKLVKIKDFPKEHKVKLFRVASSTRRTDYVVTNDKTQSDTQAVKKICDFRWKIEQFHRETKQTTGIEKCQCRKARAVRNHIGCAILVWGRLKQVAEQSAQTIYALKSDLLSGYLRQQLRNPDINMAFA